ncbi:MAG TPA: acyl carrier protein [Gammaproteobacteria bacterium]|nr:acyl carrier protein [Gammaproteobacteria bacterium]
MTTLERLQKIIVKDFELKPEDLKANASLEGLGIDSMSTIDLLFSIEDEFNIQVSREPVELKMIQDVVDYIDRLIAEQHGDQRVAGDQ